MVKILRITIVIAVALVVLTVVACQQPVTYTVVFYNNGSILQSIDVKQGDVVILPFNQLQQNGYIFVGWDNNGRVFDEGETISVESDMEFTAVWRQVFSVTFTTDDGSEKFVIDNLMAGQVVILPQCTFQGDGEFVGWNYADDNFLPGEIFVVPSYDVTFVARWQDESTVNAIFLSDGVVYQTIPSQEGTMVTLPECTEDKPDHYFVGWMLDGVLYSAGQLFEMPDGDVTFVAQWREEITLYKVNFFVDGQLFATSDVQGGSCAERPADPETTGNVFVGWYDEEGNLFDFSTVVVCDVDLYAVFGFRITFDIDNAEGTVPPPVVCDGSYVLDVPLQFDKYLHTFIGWTDGENIYNNGDVVECQSNVTLIALWQKTEVVISLYIGGEFWKEVVCPLGNCTLPVDVPNWIDENGEITFRQWISYETGEPFDGTCCEDQRFDAEFLPFVTFDAGEGVVVPEGFFVNAYQDFVLPEPVVDTTADGRKFAGWQLNGVIYQPSDKVSVRHNSTFVAVWEKVVDTRQIATNNLTVNCMSCIIEPSVSGVCLCLTVKEKSLIGNVLPRC
ncbi:MAG TPA: InlB B-repeat-containing protein [Candidatus Limihabitans stercoravium]|nr:InlB B-repeat-containing protein [Candidatus Limihabitans stercoravium]